MRRTAYAGPTAHFDTHHISDVMWRGRGNRPCAGQRMRRAGAAAVSRRPPPPRTGRIPAAGLAVALTPAAERGKAVGELLGRKRRVVTCRPLAHHLHTESASVMAAATATAVSGGCHRVAPGLEVGVVPPAACTWRVRFSLSRRRRAMVARDRHRELPWPDHPPANTAAPGLRSPPRQRDTTTDRPAVRPRLRAGHGRSGPRRDGATARLASRPRTCLFGGVLDRPDGLDALS